MRQGVNKILPRLQKPPESLQRPPEKLKGRLTRLYLQCEELTDLMEANMLTSSPVVPVIFTHFLLVSLSLPFLSDGITRRDTVTRVPLSFTALDSVSPGV